MIRAICSRCSRWRCRGWVLGSSICCFFINASWKPAQTSLYGTLLRARHQLHGATFYTVAPYHGADRAQAESIRNLKSVSASLKVPFCAPRSAASNRARSALPADPRHCGVFLSSMRLTTVSAVIFLYGPPATKTRRDRESCTWTKGRRGRPAPPAMGDRDRRDPRPGGAQTSLPQSPSIAWYSLRPSGGGARG